MFTDDELRTLAIALDVVVDGFRGKGPINVAPMQIIRSKLHNMLRAVAEDDDDDDYDDQGNLRAGVVDHNEEQDR